MSDEPVNVEDDQDNGILESGQPLYEEVTAADFAAVDLNALTAGMQRLDRHSLVDLFWDKVKALLYFPYPR